MYMPCTVSHNYVVVCVHTPGAVNIRASFVVRSVVRGMSAPAGGDRSTVRGCVWDVSSGRGRSINSAWRGMSAPVGGDRST